MLSGRTDPMPGLNDARHAEPARGVPVPGPARPGRVAEPREVLGRGPASEVVSGLAG